MDYLSHQNWSFPTSIRYGPGRVKELFEICSQNGIKRPLIITDNGSKDLGFIKNIYDNLQNKNLDIKIF